MTDYRDKYIRALYDHRATVLYALEIAELPTMKRKLKSLEQAIDDAEGEERVERSRRQ